MIISVLEAGSAYIKPPAGVGMCFFTAERHFFGASAPWAARASPLHYEGAEEDPADSSSSELV